MLQIDWNKIANVVSIIGRLMELIFFKVNNIHIYNGHIQKEENHVPPLMKAILDTIQDT
jgi:hypothetical protein